MEMKKESKFKKFFNKFFSSKAGRILFIIIVLILCLCMVLGAWAIQGKDIGKILTSNPFIFWYVVIGVGLFSVLMLKLLGNERFKK